MEYFIPPVHRTKVRYIKPGSRFILSDGRIYSRGPCVRNSSIPSRVIYRCIYLPDGTVMFFAGTHDCQRWP